MLDDLKYIHQRDASDALGIAEKQWQQLTHDYGIQWQPKTKIQNVVVAGMGGSALAATFVKSWPGLDVPFEVVRDYTLPLYAGQNTLVVASSYSGNTEEALSALKEAEAHGCQIAVIASGGELAGLAKEKGYPLYELPGGVQPRMAVFYNFAALVQLFEAAGLVTDKVAELKTSAEWLSKQTTSWFPDVATPKNQAKQLALECMGKSPVIYAGPKLFPVAYKWKINFNENAKNVAWCNQYPEFNHNEFLGWASHPVDKPYTVIDLRSNLEHERVQKRFEVTERLLSGKRPAAEIVKVQGETLIQQLLWAVCLGDFVSLYVALLNNQDPSNIDLLEKFKKVVIE